MDCNYTTIKTCELKGSTFRSRVLDFGDFDISDYTFEVKFLNTFGQIQGSQALNKIANVVEVPLTLIENKSGRIRAEVWMEREGGFRDIVVVFDVGISTTGCPSDSSITDGVSVTFGGLKVPIAITQAVVNNYLDYANLTQEQQAALRFDYEDFTPENILELQAPAIEAAEISDVATENANTATAAANAAATAANTATSEAISATDGAIDATADAITATTNANNAADFAVQATQEAVTATGDSIAATAAADSATDAADLAATNAQAKATLADTAAGNAQTQADAAQTAASTANTAANNADTNAAAAQTATDGANIAAAQANAARDAANAAAAVANAARGWSPVLVADATTIPGKTLVKLSAWIGGTGTAPTTNVGQWQTAAGGYTATAASALDLNQIVTTNVSNDVADLKWVNKGIFDFSLSGYYNASGVLTANAGYASTPRLRARAGMKFKNPFLGTTTFRQVAYFDVGGAVISTAFNEAESTAPTNTYYVAFTRTSGSSAPIQVQSDFWALQQEDFYTEFTFNSNPEKVISAVDIDTNTFTSVGHGLVNGDQICITKNHNLTENTNPLALIPGGLLITRYFIVNAATDTFQLSNSAGGSAIDITINPTMTLSKIHLEVLSAKGITVNGLPNSYGWRVISKINSTASNASLSIRGAAFTHSQRWINTIANTLGWTDVVNGSQSEFYANTVLQQISGRYIISSRGLTVHYPTSSTLAVAKIDSELMDTIYTAPTPINGVTITNTNAAFFVLNNSKVEIYKL